MNHGIRATNLRVIDENGQQLGILSKTEALQAAEQRGLDLVEISPQASPPVAKIIDWGKFNYQRTKQQQKNKRNSKTLEVKQMRVGLKISEHDLGVKLKKVQEFLHIGHKVKVSIIYRGREMAHRELGYKLADKVVALLGENGIVDETPQMAGRQLSFVVRTNPASRSSGHNNDQNDN